MKKNSQAAKVVAFLKQNSQEKFTARQIAEAITAQYPDDYQDKEAKFADEKHLFGKLWQKLGRIKIIF